jgi:hypothetical protein
VKKPNDSKESIRFAFRRTSDIEQFIQEFWELRPDLREKPTQTAREVFRLAVAQLKSESKPTSSKTKNPKVIKEPEPEPEEPNTDDEWE